MCIKVNVNIGYILNIILVMCSTPSQGQDNNVCEQFLDSEMREIQEKLYSDQELNARELKKLDDEFRCLKDASEKGHALAQYKLAQKYDLGKEVKKNHPEAFKWYQEAANQGHVIAQHRLGRIYKYGDFTGALSEILGTASNYGVTKDIARAIDWFMLAALQGHRDAAIEVAILYDEGDEVRENKIEAVKWYKIASEIQIPDDYLGFRIGLEQFKLGSIYDEGIGIPENDTEAVKWYEIAANLGYDPAQNNLGGMYYRGEGVEKNLIFAYLWWNLAAASGNEESLKRKDALESEMTYEQINEAQKLSSLWLLQYE